MSIIKEDDFDELYKPQQNHLDNNGGWSGTLYETFGEELDYVRGIAKDNVRKVWTLLDGDEMTIAAGFHLVNRLGYFITEKEWESESDEVPQDMDMD